MRQFLQSVGLLALLLFIASAFTPFPNYLSALLTVPPDVRPAQAIIVLAVGDGPRASWGVVSAMDAEGHSSGRGLFDLDLTLYPGFSGGPLVDVQGRVIGINTSGASRSRHLAIPAAVVDRLVDGLVRRGHIPRPYLGVSTQPVRLPDAMREQLHLEQATAVIVVAVQAESPAALGGLVIGDVLVSLGGASITDPMELRRALRPERVGETVVASVIRGGEARDLRITIRERTPRP